MLQGESGSIAPGVSLYIQWQNLRGRVFDAGEAACEKRVGALEDASGEIHFNAPGDITCADAVAVQSIFRGTKMYWAKGVCNGIGPGTGGGTSGTTATTSLTTGADSTGADSMGSGLRGPGLYGLTSYDEILSCVTNTMARTIECDLDVDFIDDLSRDPSVLWQDDILLGAGDGPGGVTGFELVTCGESSVLYALGLRADDLLTHLDNAAVTDYDEVLSVWGQLLHGGQTHATATVYKANVKWSMTVARVDLTTYP